MKRSFLSTFDDVLTREQNRRKKVRDKFFFHETLFFSFFLFLFLFSSASVFFLGCACFFFLRSHSNHNTSPATFRVFYILCGNSVWHVLESCNSYSYISLFFLTSRFGDDDDDDDEEDETTRAFVRTVLNSLLLLLLGKRLKY